MFFCVFAATFRGLSALAFRVPLALDRFGADFFRGCLARRTFDDAADFFFLRVLSFFGADFFRSRLPPRAFDDADFLFLWVLDFLTMSAGS
jgi:hypothetical protein